MDVKNFRLDPTQFEDMIALSSAPSFKYENGQRTNEQDGYSVKVILPLAGYENVRMKVTNLPSELSPKALRASGSVHIKPVGNLTAYFYRSSKGTDNSNNDTVGLSLRADSVEVTL